MFKKLILAMVALFSVSAMATPDVTFDSENVVVLRGEINSQSVANLTSQILESKSQELYLFISSPGGSVLAGNNLVSLIRGSGKKITCVVDIAASMAFVVTQACDTRYILPHGIAMQHVPSYGVEGQAPNNESMVSFFRSMENQSDEAQAARIGISVAEFQAKIRNDWWLFGKAAQEANVVDKVVTATCTPDLAKGRTKQTLTVFIFKVNVEWSNCPLVNAPLKVELDMAGFGRRMNNTEELELSRLLRNFNLHDYMLQWYNTRKNPFTTLTENN